MQNSDDHVLEYVDAYLHDVLSRSTRDRVAWHCRVCPICRVAMEEAQKRLELMQALPPVEAPESLIRATQQRIERFRPSRITPLRIGLAVAASLLVLLGATNLYYFYLTPAPIDLRVLGQTDLFAGAEASLRVLLQNPHTGMALAGVPIEIDLLASDDKPAVRLASLASDQFGSGAIRMQLPDWAPGKYRLRVRAHPAGAEETVVEPIVLRRSWQLILTSDKPVYQPGDIIRLRSLSLAQPLRKPVAGEAIEFSVSDSKGNVIFRKRDVTSRFGIASIDCPLATEINEGPYQIDAKIGDTASAMTVEVRKYVLPKFKIGVELDHPYYEPGQKVRGTISAKYFFGKPVANGEITIDVASSGFPANSVGPLKARTDASGDATFDFALPQALVGQPQDSSDAHFTVSATLTDAAGQKQSANVSCVVTDQPIHIDVVPESGRLVLGLKNKIYFLTTYPDGHPAPTRIAIAGIDSEIVTDDLGAASIEFTPNADSTDWLIRAADNAGHNGRREIILESGRFAEPFLVRTDKAVYDGGQTIHVSAISGGSDPLFLDVIKDGQTMLTTAIPIADGRGAYDLDLPTECFGALQLCAYRLAKQSGPITQNRIIYVRQASALKIDAQLDRSEYRPGEQAKLTVSVTDALGHPAPAAVSLAAVDEAVYSVLGQRPGVAPMLSSFEQQLLKPVYAIYPWSADADRTMPADERNRFEQALFARAAEKRVDRDALLQQIVKRYGDNDQIMLQVLDRPDWEELMQSMPDDMQKYIPLLKGEGTTYSLRDSSYRANSHATELVRNERLNLIAGIWIALVVIAAISGLIWLVRQVGGGLIIATLVICGVLVSLLLPAVQNAREASHIAQAGNNLRQLGLALESYESATQHVPNAVLADPTVAAAPAARVRSWFPETLLWRPELITDDHGRATLDIDLADSITNWRLTASAVSAEGSLGASQQPIRVFQPFFVDLNLPVSLTRGDEVSVPAVVYNYSDKPLSIELELADAPWFARLDPPQQKLDLAVNEVRAVHYRIRAKSIGRHELTIRASAAGVADAIRRTVEVASDGRRVEQTVSGTLAQPADVDWTLPKDAIEGSARATVKIFPSTFSQVVGGMEGIFQMPYGCFEQTSSTTYPNVLALDYLQRTKQSVPKVEATAQQYIHLGYQRLLSFEIAGGGFDWFGNPPANRTLTAYGLIEFVDMARVHEVDPKLIERTRDWLLRQQSDDGSWEPESHQLHDDPTRVGRDLDRLSTTAYIAWAVFGGDANNWPATRRAIEYIRSRNPATIDDPYVVALVANALEAIDPNPGAAEPYLDQLESRCKRSADGKLAWWELPEGRRTTFYGAGNCGSVETTALAALAMIHGNSNPATARSALTWLVQQKDPRGTWGSTQATLLAIKALLAGTGQPLSDGQARHVDLMLDGKLEKTIEIAPDQSDVVQQVDLTDIVTSGTHRLAINERSGAACEYEASLVHYLSGDRHPQPLDPLALSLDYNKTRLAVDDQIEATATTTNRMQPSAPMVILDLPIPAGFTLETADLDFQQSLGKIAKYQVTPRSAIVYLRELRAGEPLALKYRLRAVMPLIITVPSARAYEYYDPDRQAFSAPVQLEVAAPRS